MTRDESLPPLSSVTAVLLCGGKGERLAPTTETIPKPLVRLNGKPILDHLMEYLASAGLTRFVVCVGYLAESIEQHLLAAAHPDWNIVTVNSGMVGITQRLRDARPHLNSQILVCYGDTLANIDFASLLKQHDLSTAALTMAVYPLKSPFGVVDISADNRVVSFKEKPQLPYWINIGFLFGSAEVIDRVAPTEDLPSFLSRLSSERALHAYRHSGRHLTVNTEKERAEAESQMTEFLTLLDRHEA